MQQSGTQTLETSRLILRQLTLEDVPAMYQNWASDTEVTRYLTWPAHSSPDITRKVLDSWIPLYDRDDYYQWGIVLKHQGNAPIGCISVVSQDPKAQAAQVGYCIGRNWWRQGIMSEALDAVLDFLFTQEGFLRVEARHDPRNPYSGKVMEKCGMQYEGTHRQADWNNQGICDVAFYAALAGEWKRKRPLDRS